MSVTSFLMFRKIFSRSQATEPRLIAIKAGVGGAIAIATLVLLSNMFGNPLLMAPFGATCVLLFSLPKSPLSQPINVITGHLVSVAIGLVLNYFLPLNWWSIGLAVGLAITAMSLLRITHPPAGADPIVVFFTHPGWEYLIAPVLLGSIILVITAWLFHKIPPKANYPLPEDLN